MLMDGGCRWKATSQTHAMFVPQATQRMNISGNLERRSQDAF